MDYGLSGTKFRNMAVKKATTVSQHLPEDLLEKQQSFLSYVLYRRLQYDYPLQFIGNMDGPLIYPVHIP